MRHYLDPELLNFASLLVREQIEKMSIKWKFNGKSVIRIAKTAVVEDKIQDEKWIRTEIKKAHKREFERYIIHIAKRDGYFPFIQFRKKSFAAFKAMYGDWTIPMMQQRLQDPAKIGPLWAAQFVGAINRIGVEECMEKENLFEFVTMHEAFQEAREERKKFQLFTDGAKIKDD